MKQIDLQELKNVELNILDWFDNVCKDNSITYYLSGGTLLGAIRHKGFIPWDDDIDVMMFRTEYDRFLEIVKKYSSDRFEVRSLYNGLTIFPFAKVIDKKTKIKTEESSNIKDDDKIFIDIFPIDGLPEQENKCVLHYKKCRFFKKMFEISTVNLGYHSTFLRTIAMYSLYFPAIIIGAKNWSILLDKYARKYHVEDNSYIGVICWGYGYKERMPKEQWCKAVEVEFEGRKALVPGCWDYYLTSLYGDYMTLPPEEKRKVHTIEAYVES